MKKILFALCAMCVLMFSGCNEQNSPDQGQTNPTEQSGYKWNTYVEPSLQWGAFRTSVDREMEELGFVVKEDGTQGVYRYTSYKPQKEEVMTTTFFLDDGLTYEMAAVYLNYSIAMRATLRNFLDEHYKCTYRGTEYIEDCTYRTEDGKTNIEIRLEPVSDTKSYFIVVYTPRK